MSLRPMNYAEAERSGLLVKEGGLHLFSNGTDYECWADANCWACAWWPPEGPAGEYCAMEAAMMLETCSPALVELFGLVDKNVKASDGIWVPCRGTCRFFKQVEDYDGPDNWPVPPPPPDPDQLVLIADPTEDAALLVGREQPVFAFVGAPEREEGTP